MANSFPDEEKSLLQWFRDNGFNVSFEIAQKNVSTDSSNPDYRPDHDEKYALVDKVAPGTVPQFFRSYKIKMNPNDTVLDSYKRVKQLLDTEALEANETLQTGIQNHVIPKLQNCECPVCKSKEWRIAASVFEMRGFFGQVGLGQVIPVVLATCHICGYMLPFNAIHVAAVKSNEGVGI